jgi:hypothetical protein
MIRIQVDSLWKNNTKTRFFLQPINLRFLGSSCAWYVWYIELTLFNFEIEIFMERKRWR